MLCAKMTFNAELMYFMCFMSINARSCETEGVTIIDLDCNCISWQNFFS